MEMSVEGREEFGKVSDQKCIVGGLSGPIVLVIFTDHALDVVLAAFLCELRYVVKCTLNFLLVKSCGRGFVLERHCCLVRGEGEIWVVVDISYDEFEAQV